MVASSMLSADPTSLLNDERRTTGFCPAGGTAATTTESRDDCSCALVGTDCLSRCVGGYFPREDEDAEAEDAASATCACDGCVAATGCGGRLPLPSEAMFGSQNRESEPACNESRRELRLASPMYSALI
eukprot:Opistho-2@19019